MTTENNSDFVPAKSVKYNSPLLAVDPRTSNQESYVKLACRTAAPLVDRQNLLHAVLGIADELIEISELLADQDFEEEPSEEFILSLTKELGDVTWFTALFADWYGSTVALPGDTVFMQLVEASDNKALTEQHDNPTAQLFVVDSMVRHSVYKVSAKCVSLTKKEYAYGKPIDNTIAFALFVEALYVVHMLASSFNIPFNTILNRNIEKLDARYKGQAFSQENAINRDESKE